MLFVLRFYTLTVIVYVLPVVVDALSMVDALSITDTFFIANTFPPDIFSCTGSILMLGIDFYLNDLYNLFC